MNRKQRRAEEKAAKKAGMKNATIAPAQTDSVELDYAIAVEHHRNGGLDEAEAAYRKVLAANANYSSALLNLSGIIQQSGRFEEAIELSRRAIVLQPDHAGAHNNLGAALQKLGKFDEAIAAFKKALLITPDDASMHNNMANTLLEAGKPEEAILYFQRALELNPAFAAVHYNLGSAYKDLGRLEDAASCFRRALAIDPEFAEAHYNLGKSQQDLGQHDQALDHYRQALALRPDYEDAWTNLLIATKTSLFSKGQRRRGDGDIAASLSPAARANWRFTLFVNHLDIFRPHEADSSYDAAMAALPERAAVATQTKSPEIFEQIVALLHFGRSGTGLMHSLIDNHPEVSTLPSIYLAGYFNAGVWEELTSGGVAELPQRFAEKFAVLFDAASPIAVPDTQKEEIPYIGVKEGMTTLGDNRDEVLSVDRDEFCAEARRLIAHYDELDAGQFLSIIHAAYEHALGKPDNKRTLFYHIHNPDEYARLNFLRHLPRARLMMMVRNPVQSCDSWVRQADRDNDCAQVCRRIVTMLYDIDRVMHRRQNAIGVHMEDLKARPQQTMHALCKWLGIKEAPSLYEMTAQGKKWWGDPSSPDYGNKQEILPFDDSCIKRPVGLVFNKRDQFLLETLFHPFNVRFGYCQADPDGFKENLKEARSMLEGLLDFEKAIIERTGSDPQQYLRSGDALMFRAALTDRFDVVDEFGTYPHMLTPLDIPSD